MIKAFAAFAALMFGLSANANQLALQDAIISVATHSVNFDLGWKVGDNADYNVKGGIISGTMHSQVREANNEGYWVQQDMDLGFLGKQKIEILHDRHTGEILQLLVNGEKQTPPDPGGMEVIDSREETVTVPAGSFDAIYVKIKDTKSNEVTEAWIDMNNVPIGGLVKTIAPSQLGPVTVELTAYSSL